MATRGGAARSAAKSDAEAISRFEAAGLGVDERVARLVEARALIASVRAALNTESSVCECCELRRHADFDHAQRAQRYEAWIEKLDREIEGLHALAERERKRVR